VHQDCRVDHGIVSCIPKSRRRLLTLCRIKTAHQARQNLPETPVNQGFTRRKSQDPETARFIASPLSFTHDTTTTARRPSEAGVIQTLPEAHLASPYSTLRNRRHSTYPPPRHDLQADQRIARRTGTIAQSGGERLQHEGLAALFSEERDGTDRPPSSDSSSESSSTNDDERGTRRRRSRVEVDEGAVPEPARDLHQPHTNSLPSRTASRRRESNIAGEETRFSHFFRRHHDDAGDPSPPDDSAHSHSLFRHAPDFSFPLRTLPRVRRRGTTRYRGGSEEAVDVVENGTAGFMHSVWGTGRRSDAE
jgi:hypothetical protein